MDFFAAQDLARSKTKQLVALYFLALAAIIAALYLLFAFAMSASNEQSTAVLVWEPGLLAAVTAGTFAIIGGASLFKWNSLRSGGSVVARSVGGREIQLDTSDPHERRLLNIVEEMSIASGTPMPAVFILEESAINAFAAGYSINDAAVAVTRGCMEKLSRDELQGVVAHEFSHIFNGDMQLNIRLLGPLFGLLVIAMLGRMLLYSGSGARSSRDSKGRGAAIAIGVGVMIIGYIGLLFGRLIQAAISRQREYLADAAAVQFTRNPEGISGALKKIGFKATGSRIENEHAVETAHMFFAKALGGGFATHPPLPKRIRAIDQSWDGDFLPPAPKSAISSESRDSAGAKSKRDHAFNPAMAAAMAGQISASSMRRAVEARVKMHEAFPSQLADPQQARLLLHALILHADATERAAQIRAAAGFSQPLPTDELTGMAEKLDALSAADRFDLLKLLFAPLRNLDAEDTSSLIQSLKALADVDGKRSPREALILTAVQQQFSAQRNPKGQSLRNTLDGHQTQAAGLLAYIALLEANDLEQARTTFATAVAETAALNGLQFPDTVPTATDLEQLLADLTRLSFPLRGALIQAAGVLVQADGKISRDEWNTVCMVSLSLQVPMPADLD